MDGFDVVAGDDPVCGPQVQGRLRGFFDPAPIHHKVNPGIADADITAGQIGVPHRRVRRMAGFDMDDTKVEEGAFAGAGCLREVAVEHPEIFRRRNHGGLHANGEVRDSRGDAVAEGQVVEGASGILDMEEPVSRAVEHDVLKEAVRETP